jgi:acetylornithine deacetylase
VRAQAVDDKLREEVRRRRDEGIELLGQLVRQASTLGQEQGAQSLLEQHLQLAGFATSRIPLPDASTYGDDSWGLPIIAADGRSSLVGVVPGSAPTAFAHLSGHIDVVPVESPERWSHDPWGGEIHGSRLCGRGSGDMKAGLVAYLMAAEAYLATIGAPPGDLIFSSVLEEECTGNGMASVLAAGHQAPVTLIGEPSALQIQHAGVGVIWAVLEIRSSGAHPACSTAPSIAAHLLAGVQILQELQDELERTSTDRFFFEHLEHPFRMNVGRLHGGAWASSQPTHVTAHVRLGFGRDRSPPEVQSLVRDALATGIPDIDVRFQGFRAAAYVHDPRGPLGWVLNDVHRELFGSDAGLRVLAGTTDARSVGGDCLCFGPAAGNLHGIDEWVDLDSIVATAEVIALTLARLPVP